jgi:transposase
MAIKVRPITPKESQVLDHWQRSDDITRYRRARTLRLSEAKWKCQTIAKALGLHIETVRLIIKAFNEGGIPAITPRPRSGGRPPGYTEEVAEVAEELVRREPPAEEGRATWTLQGLAKAIAARFDHISTMSLEAVRRLLRMRSIVYRLAKRWLTSPDPLYGLRKSQRDRLRALARESSDGAAVWLDQSWFVRWPYQFRAWAARGEPLQVAQRWSEEVETTALYAALDDETQEAFLSWAEGQPNSEETIRFLKTLMAHWTDQGKRFIVLFWDKASWHTSKQTRAWIRTYNRRAKQEDLARLIVCQLPTRSPWLMPLESIFGWTKHQVLGGRLFKTVAELQAAVERYFRQRVASAKERRDRAWATALATATQNSRSVL